jgi:predicted patatin/cPLA2 family phospholipase
MGREASFPNNQAWPGHSVVREIVRRKLEGAIGNSASARREGGKLGLVVEGGGMRGVYSGGALVAMEKLGLTDVFDEVYGESAGATNSCYFLAGQAQFGINIYLDDLTSLRFANPFRPGTMLDLDYAIDVVVKSVKPLNIERVLASPSALYLAVTNALNGEPRMIDAKREGVPLLTLLKASGALVPLYNHPVMIEGVPYVDGGIANPIPIRSAIENGCTQVLVLLTRPPAFVAGLTALERLWLAPLCRGWTPEFTRVYFGRHFALYNKTRALALDRESAGAKVDIAVIGPAADSPGLGRATIGRKKLLAAMTDAMGRTREVFRELDGH